MNLFVETDSPSGRWNIESDYLGLIQWYRKECRQIWTFQRQLKDFLLQFIFLIFNKDNFLTQESIRYPTMDSIGISFDKLKLVQLPCYFQGIFVHNKISVVNWNVIFNSILFHFFNLFDPYFFILRSSNFSNMFYANIDQEFQAEYIFDQWLNIV